MLGQSDCMKIVLRSGSRPAPSQSAAISSVFVAISPLAGISVVKACQSATK